MSGASSLLSPLTHWQHQLSALSGISPFTAAMGARFIEKEAANMPHILTWLSLDAHRSELAAARVGTARVEKLAVCTTNDSWQRGCPEIIPGLRAQPFWRVPCSPHCHSEPTSAQLEAAISALEEAFPDIRKELLALHGHRIFQQYYAPAWAGKRLSTMAATAAPSASEDLPVPPQPQCGKVGTDSGSWNVAYLQLHDAISCEEIQTLCPLTMAALSRIPRLYGHSLFSSLAPGSHIATHCGPTNRKLRLHLPLVVPEDGHGAASSKPSDCCCIREGDHGETMPVALPERSARTATAAPRPLCWLRAGPHKAQWQEGKVLVFDDSFQHEAANYASTARLVLIVDVWHPDLTDPEVKLLELIRKSQLRAAKAMGSSEGVSRDDDFFHVLRAARAAGADDAVVFPASVDRAACSSAVTGGCGASTASGCEGGGDGDEAAVLTGSADELTPLSAVPVVRD